MRYHLSGVIIMYDKQIFADNLAYYMEEHKETQVDVALVMGVSKSNVSAYLKARQIPRIDKIFDLAEHYGIRLSDLLERKSETSAGERKLVEAYNSMDDEGKQLALGMMKTLLTAHAQKNHSDFVNEKAIGG